MPAIAALVVILDRVLKVLAPRWTGGLTLIPGWLGLTCTYNTGIAFSLLSGQPFLLGVLSLLVILIGWLILRRNVLGPLSRTAAALMLGGAVGNAIDRLFLGCVVDMFEVLAFRFAVFNLADTALVVGCILMASSLLFCPDEWRSRS